VNQAKYIGMDVPQATRSPGKCPFIGSMLESSPNSRGATISHRSEDRKHPAVRLLRQIPYLGLIRSVLLVALLRTPHRFRTEGQLWAYS
jgi:hypothetical protein